MITIEYDREVDALAIELRPKAMSARTVAVTNTVNVDFDAAGRLILVELLDASFHVDRRALETLPAPTQSYTLGEAERESGLRASTLRVQLNRGRIKGFKRGRDWFVDATSLLNYLESRDARGRPPARRKARRSKIKRSA